MFNGIPQLRDAAWLLGYLQDRAAGSILPIFSPSSAAEERRGCDQAQGFDAGQAATHEPLVLFGWIEIGPTLSILINQAGHSFKVFVLGL